SLVETATELSRMAGLGGRTDFIVGSALDMPVGEEAFDLALLLHVGMNINDKLDLFREVRRVLSPQGVFAVYDVMRGPNGASLWFPVPWSGQMATSFVDAPDVYQEAATAAGFGMVWQRDRTQFARTFLSKMIHVLDSGPQPLGMHLLMGDQAMTKIENYLE